LIKTKISAKEAITRRTKKIMVNMEKYTQECLSNGPIIKDKEFAIYNIPII